MKGFSRSRRPEVAAHYLDRCEVRGFGGGGGGGGGVVGVYICIGQGRGHYEGK